MQLRCEKTKSNKDITDLHFPASLTEGKSEDCGPGTHTVSSGCSCAARGQCARLELQCVFFLQSAPEAQTWEICRHRDELGLWRVMRYKQRIRAHSIRAHSSRALSILSLKAQESTTFQWAIALYLPWVKILYDHFTRLSLAILYLRLS